MHAGFDVDVFGFFFPFLRVCVTSSFHGSTGHAPDKTEVTAPVAITSIHSLESVLRATQFAHADICIDVN